MSVRWRILLIVFNQVGRGTYWRAFHFGRLLAEQGHAVTLMATASKSQFRWRTCRLEGMQLIETADLFTGSLRSGWNPISALRRSLWVKSQVFDLVHAFESRPLVLLPALAAQRAGAKLIMDWCDWFGRGGAVEERPNPIVRTVLRPVETYFEEQFRTKANGTTVINTFLLQRAIALGVSPTSILLIRNGSDTRFPVISTLAARRSLGLPLEPPLIGYVGNIYTQDAVFMATALNELYARLPQARVVLVGYFNRNLERWLDHPEMVIRTGQLSSDRVYQYLSACDLCWLPLCESGANQGRWPLKLNDYLTVGRPVVATHVGDLPLVMERHQFGIATRIDPKDFASETFALLNDLPLREGLGQAARRAAEEAFSWKRLVESLAAFYYKILGL